MEENVVKNGGKKRTGAKRVAKAVAALVIAGGLVATGFIGGPRAYNWFREGQRAKSLVSEYSVDGFLSLPEDLVINQAYDINYCSGQRLYNAIEAGGVEYCKVLDEYYTADGRDIAILTFEGRYQEVIPAIEEKIGDTVVYLPPEGYELVETNVGTMAVRAVEATYVKIIDRRADGDYSSVKLQLDNGTAQLVNVEERSTKLFSEIISETLIVDVPDPAVIVNGKTGASFRLVPRQ